MINLDKLKIQSLVKKDVIIETFDEIDSTSTFLRENIFKYKYPCIVISKKQTSGRGRRGNNFISNKEGCYFSFSLFDNVSLLTLKVAISLVEVMKKLYQIELDIKWVNDLFYHNLKCGGVLSELIYLNDKKIYIIGIGININQNKLDSSLDNIATSLIINDFDINRFIAEFYNVFNNNIFKNDDLVLKEYASHMLLINKIIDFKYDDKLLTGLVKGINKDGNLIVDVNNSIIILNSGEVSLSSKNITKLLAK